MGREDYFIGLDVGTNSVGWAVTDSNYKLCRIKGKTAWGARLFSEADTAKQRRSFRATGRRLARRRHRVLFLQEIFSEEISKIDPYFFLRLNESFLYDEDKSPNARALMPLFNDKELEKKYHVAFPTIFHLRYALANKDAPNHAFALSDIRFVYLALHHIVKYRGNFLSSNAIGSESGISDETIKYLNNSFKDIATRFSEESDDDFESFELLSLSSKDELLNILVDKTTNKVEKKKKITSLLSPVNKELNSTYIDLFKILITGGEMSLSKIYGKEASTTIGFNSDFDKKCDEIQALMGEDFEFVKAAKEIFDVAFVKSLIGEVKSTYSPLSESFINVYNEHKKDLAIFKRIVKKVDKLENKQGKVSNYYSIFRDANSECNYASFIGHSSNVSKSKATIEDFNKSIQKFLEEKKDIILSNECENFHVRENEFASLLKKATERTFLEAICHLSTSSIPHQLHECELRQILLNSRSKYNFLSTESDKIISIFTFKIPYYCGPLNLKSKYTCVARNSSDTLTPIRPWNFDKLVDHSKTRNKFLMSLTNKCSYLYGEDVLAKNSILYQDYIALDRLNGVKINNSISNYEWKNIAFETLAKSSKTTTHQFKKSIENFYKNKNIKDITISGLNDNDDFICSSRFLFSSAFKIGKTIGSIPQNVHCSENTSDFDLVEDIIRILEVFKDDRNEATDYIKEKYRDIKFSEQQLRVIKQYRCAGWGRLSKKFLVGLPPIDENGVVNRDKYSSIFQIMLDENLTLNQALFKPVLKDLSYNEIINYYNLNGEEEVTAKKLIEELPPMMRRSTTQAYRIVKEIIKLKGYEPQSIIIEVTRENDKAKKGKQTKSRKKEITDFLKTLKADLGDYRNQVSALKNEVETLNENDALALKGKHLYLYFKQLGMDMYTGEKINIEDVINKNNKYDIDHIYPQSLLKDDSLDNMVLVSREKNQKVKKNLYPIPEEIRCNPEVVKLWKFLLKKKCISSEKYNRLVRARELSEDELKEFVNRQINVVNTSNIALKKIFEKEFSSKLIFSKAAAPSFVRKEYDVPKLRDLNDTHHAVDAYLNIVCGKNLTNYYEKQRHILSEKQMTDSRYNYESIIKRIIDNNPELKSKIEELPNRHDFLLTYRFVYNDSGFYNQKLTKGKDNLIPAHENVMALAKTEKYGGYDNLSNSYFLIAKVVNKKGIESRQLIPVTILDSKKYASFDELKNKLEKQFSTNGKTISIDANKRLYNGQKLLINGCEYKLTLFNAKGVCLFPISPIFLRKDDLLYFKNAQSYLPRIEEALKENPQTEEINLITGKTVDRNGQVSLNAITFSKKRNAIVFKYLIDLSQLKKYENIPMIKNLKKLEGCLDDFSDEKNTDVPTFSELDIIGQIKLLKFMILQFSDKHGTTAVYKGIPGYYSKTFSVFFDEKYTLVEESITGLIRKASDL